LAADGTSIEPLQLSVSPAFLQRFGLSSTVQLLCGIDGVQWDVDLYVIRGQPSNIEQLNCLES